MAVGDHRLVNALANIVTGLIGGMAGCAMIGQSVISVSGGRGRLSAFVAGLFLLVLVVFLSALQRAGYVVSRAQRQYDAVDPANRLVAGSLERRWNDALAMQSRLEERRGDRKN